MGNTFRMFIRIVQSQSWVPVMLLAILVVGCAEGDVSSVDESKTTSGESVKEIETTSKTALEQEAPSWSSLNGILKRVNMAI